MNVLELFEDINFLDLWSLWHKAHSHSLHLLVKSKITIIVVPFDLFMIKKFSSAEWEWIIIIIHLPRDVFLSLSLSRLFFEHPNRQNVKPIKNSEWEKKHFIMKMCIVMKILLIKFSLLFGKIIFHCWSMQNFHFLLLCIFNFSVSIRVTVHRSLFTMNGLH